MRDLAEISMQRNAPEQRRDLSVRSLSMRAGSIDEAARSVEVILATETQATVFDMRSWSLIDEVLRMDGAEFPAQVPMLADHDRFSIESVRGSIRDIRRDGDKLVGRAYFAKDEDSERAWQKVRDGHLTDLSAGYGVREFTDIPAGQSGVVGGKTYTAGSRSLRISTAWTVREGSLVPIGADPAAKVREDQNHTNHRGEPAPAHKDQPMNFEQWLAARGLSAANLNDAQRAALRADFDAIQRAAAPAPAPVAVPVADGSEAQRAEGVRLERARVTAIRSAGEGLPAETVQRAIDEGMDVSAARALFLETLRARPNAAGSDRQGEQSVERRDPITVIVDGVDKFQRAAENALVMRAGVAVRDSALAAEASCLRGVGIHDLARLALRAHKQEAPIGLDLLFQRAISTASFPVALGNTLNRILLASYEESPSTILEWASTMDVRDFREHKAVKMGKFAAPVKVGKGGEIEHATVGEEAEGYSADTYGRLFTFDRKSFVNDDLGLFQRVPAELGAAMKRNIDDIGYALLTSASGVGPTMDADSTALFNASRTDGANYIAGATVLSSAGLNALKILLRKIKQGGITLNLVPVVLLVPPELEQTALELVKASTLYGSSTADAGKPNINVHQGSLKVVVEPRLSAGTNGTTAWYLVCSPMQARSLAVCFLRGQTSPTVERVELPPAILGLGWRAYHDVGVDAIDWRGIARSRGA